MSYHHTILHVLFYTDLYGAEQSLLTLVDQLSSRGFRSIVAVFKPGRLTDRLAEIGISVIFVPSLKPWLPNAGVPTWKRSLFNFYQIPFILKSVFKLNQVIKDNNVDLVHTGSATIIDGALAANLSRIPHVWHIRETVEPHRELTFFYGTSAARSLIKHLSATVIANSKAIARSYISSESDRLKVQVVYNGIDLAPYDNPFRKSDLLQKLKLPADKPIVGMVAQLVPLKRHEDFIRAAALINKVYPEVYFVCIGGKPYLDDSYVTFLKILVHNLQLQERVLWIEHQDNVHQIYHLLDIVVLPSQEESFGRVLIEAMAAKRPVVATAVGGMPEIVIDGTTGLLVPVHQPQALANAILSLLNNPQLANEMGKAGRNRVEENFTHEHYVNSVDLIYRSLLQ